MIIHEKHPEIIRQEASICMFAKINSNLSHSFMVYSLVFFFMCLLCKVVAIIVKNVHKY